MSCRVDTTPLLAGACVVSLYAGHGVRGDAIPSTGTHGPSPLYNDLSLPADAAKEYRWGIVTPPASGTLVVYEDGSYAYTPPGGTVNLTATYTYRLWQDGVDQGTASESIVIGAGSGASHTATMAALSAATAYAGFAATYAAPGVAPGSHTATMAALSAATAYAGFAATYAAPGVAPGSHTATMAALSAATAYAGFAATYAAPYVGTGAEPVTVAEAKVAARVDADITEADALIGGYITSARTIAEHETGRTYVQRTRRYTFADWPAADHVMHVHAATAVAIQWWDGAAWQTMDGAAFAWAELRNGTAIAPALGTSWPTLGDVAIGPRVRVDITAGSATPAASTPQCVKNFILALVGHWVRNPEAGAAATMQEAPFLARLLDPERLWG